MRASANRSEITTGGEKYCGNTGSHFRDAPIRAHYEPGFPVFSLKPAWFSQKPAWFCGYPADFTPETKSGNGTIPVADQGWDQTMNKPDQQENPGPYRARIPPFFPGTGTVFSKTGMVSQKSGCFYAGE